MNRWVPLLILLGAPAVLYAQEFTFEAPDIIEKYSGSTDTFEVDILVGQTAGPTVVTAALACGLSHGMNSIAAIDVQPTGILATGNGPCFFAVALLDTGWTCEALWAGGHGCNLEFVFDGLQPALRATYEATGLTDVAITTDLEFVDTLGSPAVNNTITSTVAQNFVPNLVNGSITLTPNLFTRGDCNSDGTLGLPDDLTLLFYLFLDSDPPPCLSACDFNGDNSLGISDAIYLQQYLFLSGAPPPAPFVACGLNLGELDCLEFLPCP